MRYRLAACRACGLLTCVDCRGDDQCAICYREQLANQARRERRERRRELGRRAAVVGLVAASGISGLAAAFFPDGPLTGTGFDAGAEMRFVTVPNATVDAAVDATLNEPINLHATAPPWGSDLKLSCVETDGVTCCFVTRAR
jgi:hypothetical protein